MAHIITIGQGRNKKYKVMYELPQIMGERKRKSKTFPAGTPKAVVDEFKRQMEINLSTGEFVEEKNISLTDFIEQVYFPIYTTYLSPTTVSSYWKLYESKKPYCVKTYFGKYKLKEIKRRMVQQYVNLLADNVSPKTVRAYKMWLHTVFDTAISEDIIKPHCNPTDNIKLPPKKKPDIEAYTLDEINKLLELSANDNINHLVIGLGTLAGLRRGEMLGLRWQDVDLTKGNSELHIVQTVVVVDDIVYVKEPKTKAGKRDIPIPETLADILRNEKIRYTTNKLRLGAEFKDKGYVISKENGEPYRPDGVSIHYERFMYKVEKEHRIPYKSLHKLRHSYATLLIDGGANPKVVQKNLGHEDVTMTLGTYAHAYADRQRSEVDKLDSVLSFNHKTG